MELWLEIFTYAKYTDDYHFWLKMDEANWFLFSSYIEIDYVEICGNYDIYKQTESRCFVKIGRF